MVAFVVSVSKIIFAENRNNNQLPLFGHFCCRLAAQPQCMSAPVYSSCVRLRDESSPSWATLQAFELSVWPSAEEAVSGRPPRKTFKVDKVTPNTTSTFEIRKRVYFILILFCIILEKEGVGSRITASPARVCTVRPILKHVYLAFFLF